MIFDLQQNQRINSLQSQYVLQNQINNVQFDKSYEALNDKSAKKFATRFTQILTKSQKQIIRAIIKNSPFNHINNIYELMKPSQQHLSYVVVTDVVEGCFKDYWEKNQKNFDQTQTIEFFTQIVKGVNELHSIGIFPQVINLENIVYVQREGKLTLKLSETGLVIEDKQEQNFAKEQKKLTDSGDKMCTWSLGVLLYEMIAKTSFFKDGKNSQFLDSIQQKYQNLKQSEIDEFIDAQPISEAIKLILKNMLIIDPEQKLSSQNILQQLQIIKNNWQNIIKQIKLSSENSQEEIILQLNVQKQDYEFKLEQFKIQKKLLMEDKKRCETQLAQQNQRFYQLELQMQNKLEEQKKILEQKLTEEYSKYYNQQIEKKREVIIEELTEQFKRIYGKREMLLLEKLKESLIEIFENLFSSKALIDYELKMNSQKSKNAKDDIEKDNLSTFYSQLYDRSLQLNQFINEIKTIQAETQIHDLKKKILQNQDINKNNLEQLIDNQNQKYEKIISLLFQEKQQQFQQINSLKDLVKQKQLQISDILNKIESLKIIFLVCMITNDEFNLIIKIQDEVQKIKPQLQDVVIELDQVKIESSQQFKKNKERLYCLNGKQNELIIQNYEQQLENTLKLSLNAFKSKIKNNCQYEKNQQNQQNLKSFQKQLFKVIDDEINFGGLLKNQQMIEPLNDCIKKFAEQSENSFTSFQRIEIILNNFHQKDQQQSVALNGLFQQLSQEMITFTEKLLKISDLSQIQQTMQNSLNQFIMSQKKQLTNQLKNIEQQILQLINNQQFNLITYLLECGLDWNFINLYSKIIKEIQEFNNIYFAQIEQYQDQIKGWEQEKQELSNSFNNFQHIRNQLSKKITNFIDQANQKVKKIQVQQNEIEKLKKSIFKFMEQSHWLESAQLQLQKFQNQINQFIQDQEQSDDQEKYIQNITAIMKIIEEIKNYITPLQIQNILQTKDLLLENLKSYLKVFFCYYNFSIKQKIDNLQEKVKNNVDNQKLLKELSSQLRTFLEISQQQDFFIRIEDQNMKIYKFLQENQQFFEGQLNIQIDSRQPIFHRMLDQLLQIKLDSENKNKLKSVIVDEQLIEQIMSQPEYKNVDGQLNQFKVYAKLKNLIKFG